MTGTPMRRSYRILLFTAFLGLLPVVGPLWAAGHFGVEYRPATEPQYADWRKELKEGKVLEEIAR